VLSMSEEVGCATDMASTSSWEGVGVAVESFFVFAAAGAGGGGGGKWGLSVSRVNVGGACLGPAAVITNC